MSLVTSAHLEQIQPPLNQLRSYQTSSVAVSGFAQENAPIVATRSAKIPQWTETQTASYSNANIPAPPPTPATAVSKAKAAAISA